MNQFDTLAISPGLSWKLSGCGCSGLMNFIIG